MEPRDSATAASSARAPARAPALDARARFAPHLAFGIAVAARLAVVAWAATRIPPAADGVYYQRIAERIAAGLGYTWLWPDGAVTYAAHYPVGYPALMAAAYVVAGPRPAAAMVVNAVIGALAAPAAWALASRAAPSARPWLPWTAGLLVALHPGLVAYTPALMTEGITAALVIVAAAVAARARDREGRATFLGPVAVGLVLGVATLVRPQCLVLAPILGALATPAATASARHGWGRVAMTAAAATFVALLAVAPWTARNCVRMKRCALVSVNGGWNLLIGADAESTGAWSPIQVPASCREVFDEAEKDACFGRAATSYIREHPMTWLGLAPRKLAATFDYAGAAPWYLHEANPSAFPWRAKEALGAVETVYERVLLLLALVWVGRLHASAGAGRLRWLAVGAALAGGAVVFTLHAWIAHVVLGVLLVGRARSLLRDPVLPTVTGVVILATAATHMVFFGAGRYSLVVFPLVAALAPAAFRRRASE